MHAPTQPAWLDHAGASTSADWTDWTSGPPTRAVRRCASSLPSLVLGSVTLVRSRGRLLNPLLGIAGRIGQKLGHPGLSFEEPLHLALEQISVGVGSMQTRGGWLPVELGFELTERG